MKEGLYLLRRSVATALGGIVLGFVIIPSAAALTADIRVVRDITYVVRPEGSLALDAYLPSGSGPHPAVLVIPGGRWMFIDKTRNDWLPTQLAELGVAAFAIDYRPSTEAPYPAAFEDAQAAVRFVRAHAERFHIDSERIGAVGGSSGGHLAALLATWGDGSTDVGARVRVAISWSGPMDLRPLLDDRDEFLSSAVESFLSCESLPQCPEEARLASPVSHVDPTDGAVYLANGDDEIIPAAQAREMSAALERSGVPHQMVLLSSGHGLSSAHSYKGFDPAFAFLVRWIDPEAATGVEPLPSPEKPGSSEGPAASVAPDGKPEVNTATRRNAEMDWLPVVAIAALVVAVCALILTIVVLGKTSNGAKRGSSADVTDPGEDAANRLVGSRNDDPG